MNIRVFVFASSTENAIYSCNCGYCTAGFYTQTISTDTYTLGKTISCKTGLPANVLCIEPRSALPERDVKSADSRAGLGL